MKHLQFDDVRPMGIGLESIAFQDSSYFDHLTDLVKRARSGEISSSAFCNLVDKATMDYKGILVETHIEENYLNGWMTCNWMTATNPLSERDFTKIDQFMKMNKFADADRKLRGMIDDKKAKVSGIFSEIRHNMCIGGAFVYGTDLCSAEAVAGVILHEVGHAFTYFQFTMGMMLFNVALSQASANLAKAKTYEEVKLVFTNSARDMGISDTEFIKETKNTENRVTQFEYFAANAAKLSKHLMISDVSRGYSQNACEELADIFAARHGAEKAVMEIRNLYASESHNLMGALLLRATGFILSAGATTVIGALVTPLFPPMLLIPLSIAIYMYNELTDFVTWSASRTGTTQAIVQIRRMQNQLIERLKEKQSAGGKANEQLVKYVQEGIAYGDSLLSKLKNNESMIFDFYSFFMMDKRDARALRQYQDRLEALAANNLFLSAAKLQTA